jgi:TFIIF-interacting CTD phosphatase-like protein
MTQTLKHLLVLDLDETLIHSSVEKLTIDETFKYEEYYVYERPHLTWFIKEISNHFRLGIWSAADELYVSSIVAQILPKDIKLEIMLGRKSCEIELDSETNTYTYEKNIADLLQLDLKLEQIILVDDNADNAKINKGNVIVIKPFFGDLHDQELKFLYNYLFAIRDVEDLREIDEHYIERQEGNVYLL